MSRLVAISLVAASIASLSACVTNQGDDDPGPTNPGPNDPDPTDPAPTNTVPRTGEWYYADVTEISSNCAAQDNGVAGSFLIDSSSLSGFHVIPNDGSDPFSCSLASGAFDCPNRALAVEDLRPGVDAVITAHAIAEGTFSSSTRGTGSQQATVTCAGSACSAIGTWPCTFEVSFTIQAR